MEKKKQRSKGRSKTKVPAPIPIHVLKGEPNPFESEVDWAKVNELTDRVFRSALGKYGWSQDEHGRSQHVGVDNKDSKAESRP